jgi:hypothetical protein
MNECALKELFKIRRSCEIKLLKIEKLIAETNGSVLKSTLGISQREIEHLLKMDSLALDKINEIGNNRAIYTLGDYSSVSRMINSLSDEDTVLATLYADLIKVKA